MVTARKWVAAGFGGPEVLRSIEADVPDPGPGQVTISVRACGMNPADAKHIAPGQDPGLLPLSISCTPQAPGKARPCCCTEPPEPSG
jgi:NADPH:quinone reductase-like Zn-dependent oxidoreductase